MVSFAASASKMARCMHANGCTGPVWGFINTTVGCIPRCLLRLRTQGGNHTRRPGGRLEQHAPARQVSRAGQAGHAWAEVLVGNGVHAVPLLPTSCKPCNLPWKARLRLCAHLRQLRSPGV